MFSFFAKKDVDVTRRLPAASEPQATRGQSSDEALMVMEAATEFGDETTVAACKRIIEANRKGVPALASDLQLIVNYFR